MFLPDPNAAAAVSAAAVAKYAFLPLTILLGLWAFQRHWRAPKFQRAANWLTSRVRRGRQVDPDKQMHRRVTFTLAIVALFGWSAGHVPLLNDPVERAMSQAGAMIISRPQSLSDLTGRFKLPGLPGFMDKQPTPTTTTQPKHHK